MYVEHPVFQKPYDENTKIWRYMDFTKLVDILERESIFFTRSDKFEDPFEGVLTKRTLEERNEQLNFAWKHVDKDLREKLINHVSFADAKMKECTVINCWHMNKYESDAMWKLYLKSNEGIAIQSTFQKLCNSFSSEEREVYIGMVAYIDYVSDTIPIKNSFHPFLHKRRSFEHERELRAVIAEFPTKGDAIDYSAHPFEFGDYVPVDLSTLIESVYVAPTAPKWIVELVERVLKKYGLEDKPVIQSSLLDKPTF
ncbi:hypothetical protein [Bacillus sp. OTU530]|uniref:hypothetical protein n=1 Tax=Bacillus sp. OTU530 TaxID=3043862 RepID=UPI00313AC54A